jgi:hypothetical protein
MTLNAVAGIVGAAALGAATGGGATLVPTATGVALLVLMGQSPTIGNAPTKNAIYTKTSTTPPKTIQFSCK